MTKSKSNLLLNRGEAAHHLYGLYYDHINKQGIDDIHPDFGSLLIENARNPKSNSAIELGYPRGNRMKYSKIPFIRLGSRPYYLRCNLQSWFDMHYAPKLNASKPITTPYRSVDLSYEELDDILGVCPRIEHSRKPY